MPAPLRRRPRPRRPRPCGCRGAALVDHGHLGGAGDLLERQRARSLTATPDAGGEFAALRPTRYDCMTCSIRFGHMETSHSQA